MQFSHFVSLDNTVVTESQPTEEDVTREALKAVQNVESMSHEEKEDEEEEDEGDSDADISIVEPKALSLVEASEAVTGLHYLILSSCAKEKEFLRFPSSMEDTFLRMATKPQRQSSLKEFFD